MCDARIIASHLRVRCWALWRHAGLTASGLMTAQSRHLGFTTTDINEGP